jgi:rhodanese-related sulfurtransferase
MQLLLTQHEFAVAAHIKEGFSTWEKQGGPVEQQDPSGKKS